MTITMNKVILLLATVLPVCFAFSGNEFQLQRSTKAILRTRGSTVVEPTKCFLFPLANNKQQLSIFSQRSREEPKTATSLRLSSTQQRLWLSTADEEDKRDGLTLRDRLRRATGFSFTVFRATLRGITGISLTAIYASTVAATGLWIRKICSVVLSFFPAWFRYFLQPFLVFYYAPLFMLRNLTGPTRKRAIAKHESMLGAWKDAVEYAEKTEKDGYWPVVVSEDGYFQMVAPPDPEETTVAEANRQMADAMAETVEHAMEVKDASATDNNDTGSSRDKK